MAVKQKARKRLHDLNHTLDLGLLRQMADLMRHPCLIATSEAEIRYVNSAWEQQFGYKLEEVVGKNTNILKSGQTPQNEYERLWQSLKAGKLFESGNIIDVKDDGTSFSLFTLIFPITFGNRKFYIQILEDRSSGPEANRVRQEFK